MARVACRADLWYNQALKYGMVWDVGSITRPRYKLGACTMQDIIPQDDTTSQRRCSKCKNFKPLTSEFFRRSNDPGGFQYTCKNCLRTPPRYEPVLEGQRRCGKCKNVFPATSEYFHVRRSALDGLYRICKLCRSQRRTPLLEPVPEGYKRCTGPCGRILLVTNEYFPHGKDYKDGLYPQCKQCKNEKDTFYRKNHPEKFRTYREATSEQRHLYDVQYRKEHSDEINIRMVCYREEHREEVLQREMLYRQTERGKIVHRTAQHNRRARELNAKGTVTTEELNQQYHRQKGKCYYCHKKLGKGRNNWQADHIIPLSRGGSNSIENIVVACPPCNSSKKDKLLHEWAKGGRLL